MSSQSLHSSPALGLVFREQLRAVSLRLLAPAALAAAVVLAFTVIGVFAVVRQIAENPEQSHVTVHPIFAGMPLIVAGLAAGLLVWREEQPKHRAYLFALPVDRRTHQLLKTASGWVWLMVVVAAYYAWMLLVGATIGLLVGPGAPHPALVSIPAWQWTVPFAAATTAYLFGSAIAIGSNRPWVFFVVLGLMPALTSILIDGFEVRWVERLMSILILGRFGMTRLIQGDLGPPEPALWGATVALWLGVAVLATLAASFVYREG